MERMIAWNNIHYKRGRTANINILRRVASKNESHSKTIAEKVKFRGALVSMIDTSTINNFHLRVVSSAPHSGMIETGVPPQGKMFLGFEGNWVSFKEQPLLEAWVTEKLMPLDKNKAEFFLKIRAVKVGNSPGGVPYPNGLHFMELGFNFAWALSPRIVTQELRQIER